MIRGQHSPKSEPVSDPTEITGPRVALVAPVALTEACLATPAFRAIQNALPAMSHALLCPQSAKALWSPYFDEVLTYDDNASPQKIAETLKDDSFHTAIFLEDSNAAKALTKLAVPQRIGSDLPALKKLVTDEVPLVEPLGPLRHRVARHLDLADGLHCEARKPENFATSARPSAPQAVTIGLAPDSDLGSAAEWPLAHFEKLAELISEDHEVTFLVISLPANGPAAASLTKTLTIPEEPTVSEGDELGELLATLSKLTLLVASDGTLPNLAAHVGLPTITLMGPRAREVHRPLGTLHQPLTMHVECSPCNLTKCPLDHRCLQELTPEIVAESVRALLANGDR